MVEWLVSNLATIIISLIMLAAFAGAIRYIYKSKKSGKSVANCSGDCGKCNGCH